MSFCIKCGLKNEAATKFCIQCGTELVRKASSSANVSPSTSNPLAVTPGPEATSVSDPRSFAPGLEETSGPDPSAFAPKPQENDSPFAPKSVDNLSASVPSNRDDSMASQNEYVSHLPFNSGEKISAPFAQERTSEPTSLRQSSPTTFAPEGRVPATTNVSWIARNKIYLIIGIIALLSFAGYRFYQNKTLNPLAQTTDTTRETGSIAPGDTALTNRSYEPPTPAKPIVADNPSTTLEPGSDAWFKDHVARLYKAENQITSANMDLTAVLDFYEFPLERYYDAKRVDANRLMKIYTDSYSGSLEHHLVRDYETRMTISRQNGGNAKVIAGCNFEFSTKQSPDQIRSRSVYNVYVFNANGKIISVYQLL